VRVPRVEGIAKSYFRTDPTLLRGSKTWPGYIMRSALPSFVSSTHRTFRQYSMLERCAVPSPKSPPVFDQQRPATTSNDNTMDLPICPNLLKTATSKKSVDQPLQTFYESFLQTVAKDIDKYMIADHDASMDACPFCKQLARSKSTNGRHATTSHVVRERSKCT
jgi:hypothetical protein